ncbi:hypothetical protein SAMD00079811_21340 [Scytonema sp. HK-05]|nr:hypothetical protein SAMD00079811_21340 [Scytonema sp. HK-05]
MQLQYSPLLACGEGLGVGSNQRRINWLNVIVDTYKQCCAPTMRFVVYANANRYRFNQEPVYSNRY